MRQVDQTGLHAAAVVSARPPIVAAEVQRSLLALARVALAAATGRTDPPVLERAIRTCRDGEGRGAVFVTLTEAGDLRGCIGSLDTHRRLREAVATATIDAALGDPRFIPVSASEMAALRIDISVLGPCLPLTEPGAFEPGVDGVIVERGGHRGLLLPEVANEFDWGATDMLGAACRKAGLPTDAWLDPRAGVRTFRTVRFGGPAVSTH